MKRDTLKDLRRAYRKATPHQRRTFLEEVVSKRSGIVAWARRLEANKRVARAVKAATTALALFTLACGVEAPPAGGMLSRVTVAGFGDSITNESPGNNSSWVHHLALPEHVTPIEYGQPMATCFYVYHNYWTRYRDTLSPGDIIVLMCHTLDFERTGNLALTLDAAMKIHDEAIERGYRFAFATQPKWQPHAEHLNPDSRTFYDAMRAALPLGTPFVDTDRGWERMGFHTVDDYYTDGVHMTPRGGALLGSAQRDMLCNRWVHCEGGA